MITYAVVFMSSGIVNVIRPPPFLSFSFFFPFPVFPTPHTNTQNHHYVAFRHCRLDAHSRLRCAHPLRCRLRPVSRLRPSDNHLQRHILIPTISNHSLFFPASSAILASSVHSFFPTRRVPAFPASPKVASHFSRFLF